MSKPYKYRRRKPLHLAQRLDDAACLRHHHLDQPARSKARDAKHRVLEARQALRFKDGPSATVFSTQAPATAKLAGKVLAVSKWVRGKAWLARES